MFHSDYSAGLGLSMNQATINRSLQFGPGLPDIYIFKRGRPNKEGIPYVGMALELKKDGTTIILKNGQNKGRLTSNPHVRQQAHMLKNLIDEGWYANFGVGYADCVRLIRWYFGEPQNMSLFDEI